MPDDTSTADKATDASSWTVDVQRGLAWTIVLLFAAVVMFALARVTVSAEIDDLNDVLKSALAVLFNIVMLVLGFFFGSSKSSKDKDDTQNKMIDKLTPPPVLPTLTPDQLAEATLSNGQRTYYGTLSDPEAKKKFLGMSDAERNAAIGKV